MRKLKIILITTAIVVSIGGAFASKRQDGCIYATQYRLAAGGAYIDAGVYGYDFICWDSPGNICTYYKPNPGVEVYYPCRSGAYQAIPHLKKGK